MADLNSSLKMGDLTLKNRLVLAPLTRARSNESRVPTSIMVEYYKQRANAGLILTEATVIGADAVGYANTPGLWNEAQAQAWRQIIDVVHEQDSKIVAQLWHVGRISDPSLLNGEIPVAPSAIQPEGHVSLLRPIRPYVTPRAIEVSEIKEIISAYKHSAELAKEAGFDGVELHAANGYLVDQFLQSGTNTREDEYGGSLENRARLLLEVVDELISVWGAGRVGVHIAPRGDSHDMHDDHPLETFSYVVKELSKRNIAFVFSREYEAEDSIGPKLREQFTGAWIANEGLTADSATQMLAENRADAVSFGKLYIANPDLLTRLTKNLPLNDLDTSTMYPNPEKPLETGYTDYPVVAE
ncbi:alkene reductase [Acinetobacter nectaris]|uniref:alkene reductase n=1 Tax=Acinetobacter nectaris TaxID=1219382 RepID=UPI001F396DE9|nr:alkene reductase [Acinetobacter nectaris]MCF9033611.1 alkene reductase [Acinetobacter nectaris]